ncbi:MAG: PilZ domain-containing protein [Labilithrix sp.]|nr:PilZ domain-containing protein [Labilithrix sp.]MCW5833503.1 PilZ domain-containing protein [Labilithrix sp.]
MIALSNPSFASPSLTSPWSLHDARRGASRREVVLPCQAVREHDFRLIADRTLDISVEGLLLPLRTRVLTGESLIVSFAIPGMWIDAEATVARVVHGRRPGDDGLAVGVLFDRIAPSARAALAGFLHGRRTPLPRRGPLARIRRGEDAPRLADEATMQNVLLPKIEDVTDVTDEALDVTDDGVDGLGVLRAVVGAWQSLIVDQGAANAS